MSQSQARPDKSEESLGADYLNGIFEKTRAISRPFRVTGEQPQVERQRMRISLALLYVSLMAAPECTSLPTKGESIRNVIHSILYISQTTRVHIETLNSKNPVLSQIEASSPPVRGLSGMSDYLSRLHHELNSTSTEVLSQIKTDVSILEKLVRSLASLMDCPIPENPGAGPSKGSYPESQRYVTLANVHHYLENIRLNKDKLKVC